MKRSRFEFTASGYTLIDKEGEPLYERALPFFEKSLSHFAWFLLWSAVSYFTQSRTPMILTVLHLFLFGCRFTQLLLTGGLKSILFPPLWVRVSRKLLKNGDIELLKKYDLASHPGLLVNLSLAHYFRNKLPEAKHALERALVILPEHPYLLFLSDRYKQIDSYPVSN